MTTTKVAHKERQCPGCELRMPIDGKAGYEGYYHCSPECWGVYAEVLGFQFSNAVVFGQVHQMTVDSYALQHAGSPHPDQSIAVHLAGLHAAFDLGMHQMQIPRLLQRLASNVPTWPHYAPPRSTSSMTVFEVALSDTPREHMARVKKWAAVVWDSWSVHRGEIASLVASHGL